MASSQPTASTERVIKPEDLFHLKELLHLHSDKWIDLGLGLGFLAAELKLISSDPLLLLRAPAGYLEELLTKWVQWPTKKTP